MSEKKDHIGKVWCEFCDSYVTIGEYNTEHGSEVCS